MKHRYTLSNSRGARINLHAYALALAMISAIAIVSPDAHAAFVLDDAPADAQQSSAPPAVAGDVTDDGKVQGEAPASTPAPPVAAAPAADVPKAEPTEAWSLTKGKLVGQELAKWGERAGWTVMWQLASNRDIVVPADTTFEGDFQTAAADVIATLAANGFIIRTKFWEGNKTMVVTGAGTTPQ